MSSQKKESNKENSYISQDIYLDKYILGGMGGIKPPDERTINSEALPKTGRYGRQAGENGIFDSNTLLSARPSEIPIKLRQSCSLTAHQILERIPIDLTLQTAGFLAAWGEWIDYRLEVGRQNRWSTTLHCFKKFMNKCVVWGPDRAIAAVDHSIEMGYRGLFEPRNFSQPKSILGGGGCTGGIRL